MEPAEIDGTPEQGVKEMIAEMIQDPETQAYTFAAVGPEGYVLTYGESNGDEESYRSICAAILVQFASASISDEKEFVREVVQEYNRRKKHAQGGMFTPNDESE